MDGREAALPSRRKRITILNASAHRGNARIDRLFWVVVGLYVLSVIVRSLIASFPKTVDVMPDELRYLDLARSLAIDGSLTIRGDDSSFQKILYPLFLMPALLFHEATVQVQAIAILNSLYVCSAVFPAYLLAKRLLKGTLSRFLCVIATLLLPDMAYSMTFMSENLYLPLALWLILVFWKALLPDETAHPHLWALGAGLICYLAYLCKEVALAFALAYLALAIASIVRAQRFDRSDRFWSLVCFLMGFLIPFIILKLSLFSGLMNSYNQASPDILLSPYTLLFSGYAIGVDLSYLFVAFLFFPIVWPLIGYKSFSREDRRLILFLTITLLVSFLTIVYTISIREDVGHMALRQHSRYLAPLLLPYLFLFIKQLREMPPLSLKSSLASGRVLMVITTAVVVLVATLFGTANLQQGFDSAELQLFRFLGANVDASLAAQSYDGALGALKDISADDGALLTIDWMVCLCRALIIAWIIGGIVALLSSRKKAAAWGMLAVIGAFFIANNLCFSLYNYDAYKAEAEDIAEVMQINERLDALPDDARVLIVNDQNNSFANCLTDTYLQNYEHRYLYLSEDELVACIDENGMVDLRMALARAGWKGEEGEEPAIDWLLLNKYQDMKLYPPEARRSLTDPTERFLLYEIDAGPNLYIERRNG